MTNPVVLGLHTVTAAAGVPAPQPPPPTTSTMAATQAGMLHQRLKVNTKSFYASTVYGYTGDLTDVILDLGPIGGVRERTTLPGSGGHSNQRRFIADVVNRTGAKWHTTLVDREEWRRWPAAVHDVLESMLSFAPLINAGTTTKQKMEGLLGSGHGLNEIDEQEGSGPGSNPLRTDAAIAAGDWYTLSHQCQTQMWRQMRLGLPYQAGAAPITDFTTIPIAGPSTRTDFADYPIRLTQLRSVGTGTVHPAGGRRWDDIQDWNNAHRYFGAESPETYLDEMRAAVEAYGGSGRKLIFTETGNNDSPQTNAQATSPRDVCTSYLCRGMFDFDARDSDLYEFEALDDPDPIDQTSQATINATADNQAHWGLVAMTRLPAGSSQAQLVGLNTPDTWEMKPQFWGLKRLLGEFADPGADHVAAPLPAEIVGTPPADLRWRAYQKRNGTWLLALWRHTTNFKFRRNATGSYTLPTPYTVTVRVGVAATVSVRKPAGDNQQGFLGAADETFPAAALPLGSQRLNGGALAAGETFRVSAAGDVLVARIVPT